MANVDRPSGFRVYGPLLQKTPYESGAAIYPGDAVKLSADGQIDPASATDALLGVALEYASAAGVKIMVADHPDQKFIVQASGAEVNAQTDIGNTAELLATAGNSTYRQSRMELDSSGLGTSSQQLLILGVQSRPDNALGTNVDCVVKINEHQLKDSFAGV